MLLAMSRDVRVILIKLADRLHNMRTMSAVVSSKRARIARETLDIYAPIAHRLGLNQIYRELQDLAFEHLQPWRQAALAKAVLKARGYRRDIVQRIQNDVERTFSQAKLNVQVFGREKTMFSIYKKMRDKRLSFAQVNDIFGFRIVVGTPTECYVAMGHLHQLYKPIPGRFKDYIAIPKANGYQSLHTTLVSPLGTAVEFQIRTESMHAVAESGIAAHWLYKTKGKGKGALQVQDAQRLSSMWLQSLVDIQDETNDAGEFLEHVKIDLFPDAVYVFTPKSKILALPRGATPVDFAYSIHSDVGDHCVAAKINSEAVSLRTQLRSGDVVEIICAPNAKPNPTWLNFVRTGRARSKIRHYLKTMELDESQELGERMLSQAMKAEGLSLPPDDESTLNTWHQLTRWSGNRDRAELLADIGLGKKIAVIVAKRLAQQLAESGTRPDVIALSMGRYASDSDDSLRHQNTVQIDGSEGASVKFATCCRPIPGDGITGYLGRGEGLLIHAADCSVGKKLFERDREHFTDVEWAEQPTRLFEAGIALLLQNDKGVLARVATAVAQAEADITHIDMGHDPAAETTTELKLLVSVRDRLHLAEVMRNLRRVEPVLRISRTRL
jgi:GTP pyrophosphokinase/guanosine-3',5'-bis(diphosphate) 3'-pyrophosphohydrolase